MLSASEASPPIHIGGGLATIVGACHDPDFAVAPRLPHIVALCSTRFPRQSSQCAQRAHDEPPTSAAERLQQLVDGRGKRARVPKNVDRDGVGGVHPVCDKDGLLVVLVMSKLTDMFVPRLAAYPIPSLEMRQPQWRLTIPCSSPSARTG